MQINVPSFENILKVWYFHFEVEEPGQLKLNFIARYSELLKVHETFKSNNKKVNVPEFPPKNIWSSENEKFMEQRKKGLETYFMNVLKYKDQLRYNMSAWQNYFNEKRKEVAMSSSKVGEKETQKPVDVLDRKEEAQTQMVVPESKKDRAEALFEQYAKKLLFLEVKLLNKANFKRKTVFVDPSPDSTAGPVIVKGERLEDKGVKEVVRGALGLAAELESLMVQNNEIQKKAYFMEFHHPLRFSSQGSA